MSGFAGRAMIPLGVVVWATGQQNLESGPGCPSADVVGGFEDSAAVGPRGLQEAKADLIARIARGCKYERVERSVRRRRTQGTGHDTAPVHVQPGALACTRVRPSNHQRAVSPRKRAGRQIFFSAWARCLDIRVSTFCIYF